MGEEQEGYAYTTFKPVYTNEKKQNGPDKKWNGSEQFLRVNDTQPAPVLSVVSRKGSIGAYNGHCFGTERTKIGFVSTFLFAI